MVTARFLKIFSPEIEVTVLYPKPAKDDINISHSQTSILSGVNIIKNIAEKDQIVDSINNHLNKSDLIIDAIFGYSFNSSDGKIKEPFNHFIDFFKETNIPILSIDVPSGWQIDSEDNSNMFNPNYLVSLGVPKICTKNYLGNHFLGGRFIPKIILDKFSLLLPEYEGNKQYSIKF